MTLFDYGSFLRYLFISKNDFRERFNKGNSQSNASNSFDALTTTVCTVTDALRKIYMFDAVGDERLEDESRCLVG